MKVYRQHPDDGKRTEAQRKATLVMLGIPCAVEHKTASIVAETEDGFPIYKCPECGKESDSDGCDVIGADDGCLFCTNCQCEFMT